MKEKKILIICYDFPPLPSVASQRPYSWSKLFNKHNIYPIIITRKWPKNITNLASYFEQDEGTDIEEKTKENLLIKVCYKKRLKSNLYRFSNILFKLLRKTITVFEHLFKWHFKPFDETNFLYNKARTYLSENEVDCLLVTGQPFILFKYAYQLHKEFNVPYILDYRDGWSTDHAIKSTLLKILSFQEQKLEKKYLSKASFFTASSLNIIQENNRIYPNKLGYLHENGIDYELISILKKNNIKIRQNFYITYTGSFYNEHKVDLFLDALEKLILSHQYPKLKVRFVGVLLKPSINVNLINTFKSKYPEYVEIINAVQHRKALEYQLSSSILLKFDYTGQYKGLLGSKLYEYAATNVPILTVLSVANRTTTFYPNKRVQFMACSSEEIEEFIKEIYSNFCQGKIVKSDLTESEIKSFSRENKIEEFAQIIKEKI